jgi:hypothetical protein
MWDARNGLSAGATQQTYDLDDWRQVRWVLIAVNWKPNNAPGAVDLYLTPQKDCRWTVVYTHEQPLCGPYFCGSKL